jgi:multiphosphoryl transfer protein
MLGLVLVAHSRPLALALRDLARQVTIEEVKIAVAAGAGTDHMEFGTDAIEILEAIQSVMSEEGVLILMDLGSAVLSAQVALELLDPEDQKKVRFCSAPLVEGAIAAAVQASLGMDLETTCREASMALLPKKEQLGEAPEVQPVSLPAAETHTQGEVITAVHTLHNTYGLHARPAAQFVQTAAKFDAQVWVRNRTNDKGPVSARSLNAVATLGAVQNHEVEISASGPQANEVLAALSTMIVDNFGESTAPPPSVSKPTPPPAATPEGSISTLPIAEGYALAPIFRFETPPPPIPQEPAGDPESEWNQLKAAFEIVRDHITEQRRQMLAAVGAEQASIFDAHLLILEDPEILDQTQTGIKTNHLNAALAWNTTIEEVAALYRNLSDPYLQQRASDVRDVGNQVLFALSGSAAPTVIHFDHPVILAAEELTPTQTAQLDLEQVHGIITILGGPTSHSAILARSLGIPAISGAPFSVLSLPEGTPVALDGASGALWISPTDTVREDIKEKRQVWLKQRQQLLQHSRELGATADGYRVEIVANVGSLADAQAGIKNGAEGIGLLRTEFLFLTRTEPPSEDEQYQALAAITQAMENKPVIVRTLDVGGDKPLPYINLPTEANPFLGVRAIRLSFQRPDLFLAQLKAILRAGAVGNVKIMFPMISSLEEIQAARKMLETAHQELIKAGQPHTWPIETGIMVEVPSAAVLAPMLAPAVDFFSIGTNDLTQYTLAAERGNASLASLADALHPAVLHLIKQVTQGAHAHGKWVGVCGELAGDAAAAPLLVGLGVDELSMNAGNIPKVKAVLRAMTHQQTQEAASEALKLETTAEVRRLANTLVVNLNLA